ncbi:MAG: type II secretion system F family protein, partial [Planctomycetaceae bacterium]
MLIVDRHITMFAEEWNFEQSRRVKLRASNVVYRLTEPLIDELALSRLVKFFNIERVAVSIGQGGIEHPWKANEYVALSLMESLLLLLGVSFFSSGILTPGTSVLSGMFLSGAYLRTSLTSLHRNAAHRVDAIQRRLPFGIDLIALIMKAGAGFRDALQTVVTETGNHPFAEEFQRVLNDVNRGQTLHQALGDLDARLRADSVREVVFAIQKSEELGTPLADIFANVADQMRQKKSQWAESAAGKAQVQIQFPGLIIMLA